MGAGEGGLSEEEEEEGMLGEQAEDPPVEEATEAPESASNDEGASPAGVSVSVEMNVVHVRVEFILCSKIHHASSHTS